jgi:hypothetical protein
MGDLTTLATTKAWLGIPTGTTEDTLLNRLITAASGFIQSWLNRQLLSASYTETRDGHGGPTMVFANYPVTAVASVTVDGVAIPAAASVLANGYRFTGTMISLAGYLFTRGTGNVTLVYTAGYAAVPSEIEQACLELIGYKYKERDRIGHESKSLAGEVVTFITKDMPEPVKAILKNYRKVAPI